MIMTTSPQAPRGRGGNYMKKQSRIDNLVRKSDDLIFQYLVNIFVSLLTTLIVLKLLR